MEELVTYLARNLVTDGSQVKVDARDANDIRLSVAKDDRGAIIGKGGRTIKAIRTLLRTAGMRTGDRANLTLED